jgi:hypothetical protein
MKIIYDDGCKQIVDCGLTDYWGKKCYAAIMLDKFVGCLARNKDYRKEKKALEKCGEFQWCVIEAGEFGELNRVDIEETELQGRIGKIDRNSSKEFDAEVELKHSPYCTGDLFTSRNSARNWCERMIRNDIKGVKN